MHTGPNNNELFSAMHVAWLLLLFPFFMLYVLGGRLFFLLLIKFSSSFFCLSGFLPFLFSGNCIYCVTYVLSLFLLHWSCWYSRFGPTLCFLLPHAIHILWLRVDMICALISIVSRVSWCALPAFLCLCELTMVCSCWGKAWTAGYTLVIVLILVILGIFLSVEILVFK